MQIARTIGEVRERIDDAREGGLRIGFVPTMGFLHEGHLSLIRRCRELSDYVVISIYVNPTQFGPGEDYASYPKDVDRDHELAQAGGVDLVFTPGDAELYPEGRTVAVTPGPLAERLCGLSRPGHFEGVLTVVAKLFNIVTPDVSVFGQKDFQQSVLIRAMVTDLNMPVEVEVAPTVREADGLAMSSRNQYLSTEERGRALSLSRGLAGALAAYAAGDRRAYELSRRVTAEIDAAGDVSLEYVEVVSERLEPVEVADDYSVIAVAARVGSTRLIDNAALGRPDPGLAGLLQKSAGPE